MRWRRRRTSSSRCGFGFLDGEEAVEGGTGGGFRPGREAAGCHDVVLWSIFGGFVGPCSSDIEMDMSRSVESGEVLTFS